MSRILLTIAAAAAIMLTGCNQLVVVGASLASGHETVRVHQLSRSQIVADLQETISTSKTKSVNCETDESEILLVQTVHETTPQQQESDQPIQCPSQMEA